MTFSTVITVAQDMKEIIIGDTCSLSLPEKDKLEIQPTHLSEKKLLKTIEDYIVNLSNVDTFFVNHGYIELGIGNESLNGRNSKISYRIKDQYANFDNLENDQTFPLYYTFVKGKLIVITDRLISNTICYKFKKSSKIKFQKLVEPIFEKPEDLELYDNSGNKVKIPNARPNRYKIHGGILLFIFDDGESVIINR